VGEKKTRAVRKIRKREEKKGEEKKKKEVEKKMKVMILRISESFETRSVKGVGQM
jgi:hypothetical protein